MIHDLILLYHIYNAWNVDIIYYDHGLRAKVVEAVPDERPSNQKKIEVGSIAHIVKSGIPGTWYGT